MISAPLRIIVRTCITSRCGVIAISVRVIFSDEVYLEFLKVALAAGEYDLLCDWTFVLFPSVVKFVVNIH